MAPVPRASLSPRQGRCPGQPRWKRQERCPGCAVRKREVPEEVTACSKSCLLPCSAWPRDLFGPWRWPKGAGEAVMNT